MALILPPLFLIIKLIDIHIECYQDSSGLLASWQVSGAVIEQVTPEFMLAEAAIDAVHEPVVESLIKLNGLNVDALVSVHHQVTLLDLQHTKLVLNLVAEITLKFKVELPVGPLAHNSTRSNFWVLVPVGVRAFHLDENSGTPVLFILGFHYGVRGNPNHWVLGGHD